MNADSREGRGGVGLLGLGFGVLAGIVVGVLIGATVLRPLEPRSLLAWQACQDRSCLRLNEVTGLVAALGIKLAPGSIPLVAPETSYSVVLRHPFPEARVHYIIIPKKDIKNVGELRVQDQVYLTDAFALMQDIVKQEHLEKYIIKTNGPGYQDVAYLHFHLMAE